MTGNGDGTFNSLSVRESGFDIPGNVKDLVNISGAAKFNYFVAGVNNQKIQLHLIHK